jgi:DNA helicase II / ATP-dependent DNA helicase PcrA
MPEMYEGSSEHGYVVRTVISPSGNVVGRNYDSRELLERSKKESEAAVDVGLCVRIDGRTDRLTPAQKTALKAMAERLIESFGQRAGIEQVEEGFARGTVVYAYEGRSDNGILGFVESDRERGAYIRTLDLSTGMLAKQFVPYPTFRLEEVPGVGSGLEGLMRQLLKAHYEDFQSSRKQILQAQTFARAFLEEMLQFVLDKFPHKDEPCMYGDHELIDVLLKIGDQDVVEKLALAHPNSGVRVTVLPYLQSQDVHQRIAQNPEEQYGVRHWACHQIRTYDRLMQVLENEIAQWDTDDPAKCEKYFEGSSKSGYRLRAGTRHFVQAFLPKKRPDLMTKLASIRFADYVAYDLVESIQDETALVLIAKHALDERVRHIAVYRMSHEASFVQVADSYLQRSNYTELSHVLRYFPSSDWVCSFHLNEHLERCPKGERKNLATSYFFALAKVNSGEKILEALDTSRVGMQLATGESQVSDQSFLGWLSRSYPANKELRKIAQRLHVSRRVRTSWRAFVFLLFVSRPPATVGAMSEEASNKLLEGLNESQLKAVTHGGGPLLIVAGAGTGKTTVLTRRYAHLLEKDKLTSENILALTFTEKAAGEMEDRVLQLLPNGTYDFWISTFHGFCQRVLEQYAIEIGLPNHFRLLNETDAWLLLKRHINELPLDHYRPLGNPVKFLGALLKHFSRAKDEGVTPERYLQFAESAALDGDAEFVTGERARLKELAECFFTYQKLLRDEGAMDFGDLIVQTLRLLRERPRVLKELRAKFKYVLVDEFQDTNWAQYELIRLLSEPERNLTVVGDDDQSIYKFRGASLANILQFRDDYPDAQTVTLTENYRSRQEVLDASYDFIRKNDPNRLEVRLASTGLSKKLQAAKGPGGKIDVAWYKTLQDEAEGVARRIRELKDLDPELTWNDFAVLSRSNDGAEPFIFALERHGIPFRFYALRGLYAKPVVLDLFSILSLCDGYHESSAVWRAMTAPCYDIGAGDIAECLQLAQRRGLGLWEVLTRAASISSEKSSLSDEGRKKIAALVNHVQALAETARRERPLKVLQFALDKTGYLAQIMKMPETDKIETIKFLNAFANRIQRYEATVHAPSLREFLNELRLEIDSGEEGALAHDPDEGPELVKVMTVHASKGLEFEHVFIVSMVDQRFPTRARSESIPLPDGLVNERLPEGDAHLEEERRLFYVALTRAKTSVTLSGAEDYGGARKKKPSAFLSETGLEVGSLTAKASSELLILSPPVSVPEEELSVQEVYGLKRRFSFTQLAAFRNCPLQYKFAHVYKIPILGSFQKSFGQSIHLTFHDILSLHDERGREQQGSLFSPAAPAAVEGFRVPLDEALQIYEERWIDDWYPDRAKHDEYKKVGREAVKAMHARWSEQPPKVALLEQSFDWRLGEHSLKGAVDRIDHLTDGSYAIYDYKTGEPKTSDDLDTGAKEQLWIYQIAMEERGMSIKKLAYVYVRTGQEAEVDLLQGAKREAFKEELAERMKEILISQFPAAPSPFTCKNCDFRHICEFRRL